MCAEQNHPTAEPQDGALISALWLTEAGAGTGLIALKTSLRKRGWQLSTVALLEGPGSSFRALVMAAPSRSPYTRDKTGHAHMPLQLRNLRRCLQQFEIDATDDLVDLYYQAAVIVPGIAT